MKQLIENWNRFLRQGGHKYRILSETSFSRVITDYGKLGYIIITSDRTCKAEKGSECSEEEETAQQALNEKNLNLLIKDARGAGYGYLPVFGGYREKVKDPEAGEEKLVDTENPENSIVIALRSKSAVGDYLLPTGKDGEITQNNTIEDLREFGASMAKKYNQDSFFYKPPNEIDTSAYYLDSAGNITDTFTDFTVNDLEQIYYTQMARGPRHRFTALYENENSQMFFRVRNWPTGRFGATDARNRRGEFIVRISE